MKPQILVLCPSRSRPKQCKEMIDSFLATSKMSTLKLLLDNDDPCLEEYFELCSKVSFVVEERSTITKMINSHWESSSDCYKWFSVTNDDFIYKTDCWDLKLIGNLKLFGGYGIAYGNDLLQGVNMPTTSVVSREIVNELEWLQMPRLTHLFGDTVWQTIGLNTKCLFYSPEVIIEHRHYMGNKAVQDDIYKKTNSREMYDRDTIAYMDWHVNDAKKDIEKVKNLLQKLSFKY